MRIRSAISRFEWRDGWIVVLRHRRVHALRMTSLRRPNVVDRSSESLVAPIVKVRR